MVEVLNRNGRSVPDGESGELVVTDLNNYHVPLLRYTTGDFGSIGWTQCICGLSLPVLNGLSGRTPVHFVTADGMFVDTAVFAKSLERLPIFWYRLTQSSDENTGMEYCSQIKGLTLGLLEFCQDPENILKLTRPVT